MAGTLSVGRSVGHHQVIVEEKFPSLGRERKSRIAMVEGLEEEDPYLVGTVYFRQTNQDLPTLGGYSLAGKERTREPTLIAQRLGGTTSEANGRTTRSDNRRVFCSSSRSASMMEDGLCLPGL